MKKVKLFSVLCVCFVALALLSCEDSVTGGGSASGPEAALNGTWVYTWFDDWESEERVLIFNNGNWEYRINSTPVSRGIISITGNHFIISATQIHVLGGWDIWDGNQHIHLPLTPGWYSRSEIITAVRNSARAAGMSESRISDLIREFEEENFAPQAGTFILSANHLSLKWSEGGTHIYTRRN